MDTDVLIVRPLAPLLDSTRYAMVLVREARTHLDIRSQIKLILGPDAHSIVNSQGYRNNPKFPANCGLMAIPGDGLRDGVAYLHDVLMIFEEERYPKGWNGDQYAVSKTWESPTDCSNTTSRARRQCTYELRWSNSVSPMVTLLLLH
eukprot:scaffold823_cov397-Prasinococcus_capsulatus_cf.AAC.1